LVLSVLYLEKAMEGRFNEDLGTQIPTLLVFVYEQRCEKVIDWDEIVCQ